MTEFLVALATLTLGGGAAILLLLLVGQLTGRRYSARWRCCEPAYWALPAWSPLRRCAVWQRRYTPR